MEDFKTVNSKPRIDKLDKLFESNFDSREKYIFSSPGRIEIIGNHTDHNNGRVVAAAIDLDSLAVVSKTVDQNVNFISTNLNQKISLNLNELDAKSNEIGSTASLIRGIAAKFVSLGNKIGGFNCVVESEVAIGSGLSSSASIEILIGQIFNHFYNEDKLGPIDLAKIGQSAENIYFGKPCGLMDQLAIANGGIVGIDFLDFENPRVTNIRTDLSPYNYSFVIVNTGGSHADLTDDYAAIPKEMKSIAQYFGKETLRFIQPKQMMDNINEVRENFGDRAWLRANHFIQENKRAEKTINLLNGRDFDKFLDIINEAGNSSIKWLQNAFSTRDINHQGISLAMNVTENFFNENNTKGAVKVHGGGFAGTILTVVPNEFVESYIQKMDEIFGEKSSTKVTIRETGTKYIGKL